MKKNKSISLPVCQKSQRSENYFIGGHFSRRICQWRLKMHSSCKTRILLFCLTLHPPTESHIRQKFKEKFEIDFFTPPPKVVEIWKKVRRGSFFKTNLLVTPKNSYLLRNGRFFNWDTCFSNKLFQNVFVGVEKWNVGNHLKRVLAEFRTNWSHPREVNGRLKFWFAAP